MSKTACVILARGTEEMEFVICADILRRVGVDVTVAGLAGCEPVPGANNIVIQPDVCIKGVSDKAYDVIVMPGGFEAAIAMSESPLVKKMLKKQESEGRFVAAICAAPIGLATHEIGLGKTVTSYPAVKEQLVDKFNYMDDHSVIHDGFLITSRGPATAFCFALKIADLLVGKEKVMEVAQGLLLKKLDSPKS